MRVRKAKTVCRMIYVARVNARLTGNNVFAGKWGQTWSYFLVRLRVGDGEGRNMRPGGSLVNKDSI